MKRRFPPLALLLVLAGASAASAQSPAPASTDVQVRPIRAWFGPQAPLALEVDVTNRGSAPLERISATVALYDRVRSRSQLRSAFDGKLPRTPLEAFTLALEDLPSRGSQRARVEQSVSELHAFQGAPDGVYPIAVTLRRQGGDAIKTVATAVAYVGGEVQNPLAVVPVLALLPAPLLGPDAAPTARTDRTLAGLRRALSGLPTPGVPFGLAISPLMLDELRALRATSLRPRAEMLETALREAASGAEVLAVPYSPAELPHLPDLDRSGGGVAGQLDAGRAAIRRWLGAEWAPVLYPPGLALDSRAVGSLAAEQIRGAIAPGALVPPVQRGLTSADPANARGVVLLPDDPAISAAASSVSGSTDLGRVVAELAMVYFESPARQRTIVVSIDGSSRNGLTAQLLESLREIPWARAAPPSRAADSIERTLRTLSSSDGSRPSRAYTRGLADAERAVDQLASFTLPDNPRVAELQGSLRAALSTAPWRGDWSRGVDWTRGIVRSVDRERRLVSTAGTAPVTFTSHRGQVPITVINRTGYPVRIRVAIESPKLRFPEGASRVLESLSPPGELVTFPALTDDTGTFPLKIRLTSPDGGIVVHESELVVRSTAYNVVGLGLTVGAAAFLIIWSVSRWVVRRRTAHAGQPA